MKPSRKTRQPDRPAALLVVALAATLAVLGGEASGQVARPRQPATTLAAAPPLPPQTPDDRLVDAAIRRGLGFLWKRQSKGRWDTKYSRQYPCGAEALATLAALSCGHKRDQPNVKAALAYLDSARPDTVYARAIRAMVYARLPGPQYAKRLAEDVQWLVRNQARTGGWGYGPNHPTTVSRKVWIDNSNTQLALLALHEAAGAGAKVPNMAWQRAARHWIKSQNADGGWGYEPRGLSRTPLRSGSYGSLSAAGVASMLILYDRLLPRQKKLPGEMFNDDGDGVQAAPRRQAIVRGLGWLERHYAMDKVPRWLWGGRGDDYFLYYLHCLVRAAESAGASTISGHNWAAEAVSLLLRRQGADGSWSIPGGRGGTDAVVQTSFALLVLARCRTPILMSTLTSQGKVTARKRNPQRLVEWVSPVLGRRVSWAPLAPDADAQAYRRAPILYVDAVDGMEITPAMSDKIAELLQLGGTVVIQCPVGDKKFAAQMVGFFRRAAPHLQAGSLPAGHPLFGGKFDVAPIAVTGIGDAVRTRVFLLTDDLAGQWRMGFNPDAPEPFQLFANLVMYAIDPKELEGRFVLPRRPARAASQPEKSVTVARVMHRGGWNVCPQATRHLGGVIARAVGLGVQPGRPVGLDATRANGRTTLLWLTGTAAPELKSAQRTNLKRYLAGGGMVFMDSAMGGKAFFDAALAMLVDMFGRDAVAPLPKTHPLLTGKFAGGMGADVTTARYTAAANRKPGPPPLHAVTIRGRVAAVLSPLGVTVPMSAVRSYGCAGLSTPDARRLAANVLLYAASQRQQPVN